MSKLGVNDRPEVCWLSSEMFVLPLGQNPRMERQLVNTEVGGNTSGCATEELRLRAAWRIPTMRPQGVSSWSLPWAPSHPAPAEETELLNVAGSSLCMGDCPVDD